MVTRRHMMLSLAAMAAVPREAFAAPQAQLRLKTPSLTAGQTGTLAVVVVDGSSSQAPEIASPDGVNIQYTGMQQNVSVVNGRVSKFIEFQYAITAMEPGSFTVGPAAVRAQAGHVVTAPAITLEVAAPLEGDAVKDVAVEASFDVSTAWEGQVVLYRFSVRSRRPIADARWMQHPDDGVIQPRDGTPERRRYRVADAAGALDVDDTTVPFVLTRSGDLSWKPPVVELSVVSQKRRRKSFFGFFQETERVVRQAETLSMKVRPLPAPPPGFSGLVGDFRLRSQVDKRTVGVGSSVRWLIELTGNGTLEGFQVPELPDVDNARVYEGGQRATAQLTDKGYASRIIVERSIVPTQEGQLSLPPLEVVVFSPSKGTYETLHAPMPTLRVTRGEGEDIDLKSFTPDGPRDEFAPIEAPTLRAIWATGPGWRVPWLEWLPVALASAATPTLAVLAWFGLSSAKASLQDRREAQKRPAKASELLHRLPDDRAERLARLDELLRLAIQQATEIDDRREAIASLSDPLAGDLIELTERLDRVRFAGHADDTLDVDVRDAITTLEDLP